MRLKPNILTFVLICFDFVRNSFSETNITDYKASDCNRGCTTGYSDSKCWTKTFEFFIQDMINNMNNYLGVASTLSNLDIDSKMKLINELQIFEKKIVDNFMEQLDEESDIDLQSIAIDLLHLFNFTREEFNQIINQKPKKKLRFKQCPTDSGCFKRRSFESMKLFISFIMALTLLTIIIYIVTYLFVENKFVKKLS